jgi:hypothetical protein
MEIKENNEGKRWFKNVEIKLNNEDLNRLNDIIGSLLIKQFDDGGGGQEHYRTTITTIITDFFKAYNSSVKIYK